MVHIYNSRVLENWGRSIIYLNLVWAIQQLSKTLSQRRVWIFSTTKKEDYYDENEEREEGRSRTKRRKERKREMRRGRGKKRGGRGNHWNHWNQNYSLNQSSMYHRIQESLSQMDLRILPFEVSWTLATYLLPSSVNLASKFYYLIFFKSGHF